MVHGARELIAGVHTDPQFGRCVMLGIGGVLTEALADVAFRLVPITADDADDMLDELRTQALLGHGARGARRRPRAPCGACCSRCPSSPRASPQCAAVDLNPLIVSDGRPRCRSKYRGQAK